MVCCVTGCQSGSGSYKGPKFTLYKFRMSEALKKLWMDQIDREGFTPTKSSVVCSKHFAESAFETSMEGSRGRMRKVRQLRKFAIPTLFLRRPSEMSNEEIASPSVPQTSATTPTADGDHSYSSVGGDKNDGVHEPLDSMVQSEIVVSGSDGTHEEPAQKQNPPETTCRKCIDKDTTQEDLLARIQQLEQEKSESNEIVEKLKTIFNEDMVRKMMKPSSSTMHFKSETILECILIYYRIGTTAYEMFRKRGYPYPSLSTLKNHLRQVDCDVGILDDFFVFIRHRLETLEPHEKFSIICGDEMGIKVNFESVLAVA